MDPKLAEIYGTNTPDEADIEKLAAAELADQLADDGDADLDEVDEDTLEALAQEVLEVQNSETEEDAPEASNDEEADEGQMKVAEADYLGRVMAHAYVQELRGIEKEAGMGRTIKGGVHKALGALKDIATGSQARAAHRAIKGEAKKGVVAERVMKNVGKSGVSEPSEKLKALREKAKGKAERVKTMRKERAKGVAKTGLLYGGGTTVAGLGAHKALKKESSALETLVERRALEILAENGIDPTVVETEQEKVSEAENAYDVLAGAVEQKAWEMLQEAGYVSDE